MENNVKTRESSQEGKAHDQETQTTFDIKGSVVNQQPSSTHHSIPDSERSQATYGPIPWNSGRYPSSYSDHRYPYESSYPTPPPHGPYYPTRSPHWHPPEGLGYPPNHSNPIIKQSEYPVPHRNYYQPEDTLHRHVEIARPKPEWPTRGYHQFTKPIVPAQFLATMHSRNVHSEYRPPSTATSLRSTVLDIAGSSISSPRGSAHINRKRARSNTPSSIESIDLNMLIRNSSPDSLLGILAGSRISSAGSFGHLSPIGFCTTPSYHRAGSASGRPPPFITPPPIQPIQSKVNHDQQRDAFPSSTTDIPKKETNVESMSCAESPPNTKMESQPNIKEESMETKLDSTTSPGASVQAGSDNEPDEGHGEVEEVNLTCHWRECTVTFDNQADLVNHVNNDHIKKEKRDFTCYWQNCCREQKPFKAQYMLVVHMRRHTGEKPHVCTYAGCTKAYSRLENLKTHLRSHTGERPYVCEVEGCSKAFSNASDRAKHQNRTHSSVKPYICKVPGCPKRYTDPSSLRKHTKTVHGDQGAKRLKSDNSKDKETNSKKPTQSEPNQPSSNANSTTVYSPSSDVKSPGSGSGSSTIKKTGGYSSSVVSNSYEADPVSSTCDIGSPAVDIPGNHEVSLASTRNQHVALSPRTPPFKSNLPDIAEGNWEPGVNENAVTTVQAVVCERPSQTVTLPKIHNKSHDIASWVNEVHRRMSQTSRRSSESSHLSVDLTGDASRRSSESGWASNNESRRSSQNSLVPHPPLQQVNKTLSGSLQRSCKTLLPPMPDADNALRRASEASHTSSGYGSHTRSPMFHRMPYPLQKEPFPSRFNGQTQNFRRSSDTVICAADSSDMSRKPKGEQDEYRRRSEPAHHIGSLARPDPQLSPNFTTNEAECRETELINDVVDPTEFDAYLSPEQLQQPMARPTQPLRHFPYPGEVYPRPQHPVETQTIHYRPNQQISPNNSNLYYTTQSDPVPNRLPRYNSQYIRHDQFYQRQPRLEALPQGQMVMQYQQRPLPVTGFYEDNMPMMGDQAFNAANYQEMLDGMEGLSTSTRPDVNSFELGNGNMVINDMNTLLNSLIEEDKYLEMQQNAHRMPGSAMSGLF